jgi:hypothetical protein
MSQTPAGLTIVTAASSNHAGALRQMLESLRLLSARVECYDIGLTEAEAASLPRWDLCTHRRFAYDCYPPYFNVNVAAGEYAWKPVIVADVIDRVLAQATPCDVLWADAGCFFHALQPIADAIACTRGLWVRTSAGTMREWTHPLMFTYLQAGPEAYGDKANADATLVGFATGSAPREQRDALYRDVVQPWRDCALTRDCIAPAGSSRANHRQDQAVLSYLVHRGGYPFADATPGAIGVRTKCDRWFYHYLGFDVPAGLYAWTCLA